MHWALVALVIVSWATADSGPQTWHRASGYAVLVLVLFRIYWGFAGGATGRFAHFLRGPGEVLRYLNSAFKGAQTRHVIGHNPAGGWSAIAMLTMLLVQAGLGLFAIDVYGLESGPLARYISFETGREIADMHETTFDVLLVLILLHVAAVVAYLIVKRDNLILPMLTGIKRNVDVDVNSPVLDVTPLRAVVGICASALLVLAIIYGL